MSKIQANAFKLERKKIPEKVFLYRFIGQLEEGVNLFQIAGGAYGILYGENIATLVSTESEDFKPVGEKSLEDFGLYEQEELVAGWVRKLFTEKNLDMQLRKAIVESLKRRGKRLGEVSDRIRITIYNRDIERRVFYHNREFYLVIDFGFSVSTVANLWDYVDRDVERLKEMVADSAVRRIKFIFNPRGGRIEINKVKVVLDKKELERTIKKYILGDEKYAGKYNKWKEKNTLDKNQPILKIRIKGKDFSYIPQFCTLIFNLEDASEWERRELMKVWTFTNRERLEIITEAVQKVFGEKYNTMRQFLRLDLENLKETKKVFLIAKGERGDERLKDTFGIFRWMRKKDATIYLPYYIPDMLKGGEIKTYILVDEEIKDRSAIDDVTEIFRKYNTIRKRLPDMPKFDYRGRVIQFSRKTVDELMDEIEREELGFALIVGEDMYKDEDYYEGVKRRLFNKSIISQNVIRKNLKDYRVINNLLIQIMSKLGIRYFALDGQLPYDYVLGLDVGNDPYGRRSIGGCSVVFDNNGKLEKIVPIEATTGGEKMDTKIILERIQDGEYLDFRGKRVLILRDGRSHLSEVRKIEGLSRRWKAEFTVLGILKSSPIRLGTDDYGYGGVINEHLGLLLAHSTKSRGARPVVVENKWIVSEGSTERGLLTDRDIEVLWKLTKLNYSTLFGGGFNLRLPAPVHYADKFVKALGKGWKIREELLREGFLYFI